MLQTPDFYISSSEGYGLDVPRECYRIKRLESKTRNDLLLVQVNPALSGLEYGLAINVLDYLILVSRHEVSPLFPIVEWPVFVYVFAVLVAKPDNLIAASDDQMKLIAWAELYKTKEDALAKRF